jgi:hypothetical protein
VFPLARTGASSPKEALIYSIENKSVHVLCGFSQFSAGKREKQSGNDD